MTENTSAAIRAADLLINIKEFDVTFEQEVSLMQINII
jgi:hypothetical protein